jgi:hypothetical protein
MPPRKGTKGATKKREELDDEELDNVDVKYNPEIVSNALNDLKTNTEVKCQMILRETDFLITSLQQAFHLEMIKLPANVKQMSMQQFREEFNFSLEAVTRSVMLGAASTGNFKPPLMPHGVSAKASHNHHIYETPSAKGRGAFNVMQTPMTAMRNPREGEVILSTNGSPLGEFTTVRKAPRGAGKGILVPPTPGVFVPLKNGDIVDIDSVDVENMPEETKLDTLQQMAMMMQNMQAMMEKLQGGSAL